MSQELCWFSWAQQYFIYGNRGRRAQNASDVRQPVVVPAKGAAMHKRAAVAVPIDTKTGPALKKSDFGYFVVGSVDLFIDKGYYREK